MDLALQGLLVSWEAEGPVRWCEEVGPILADRLEELGDERMAERVRLLLRQHAITLPCGEGAWLFSVSVSMLEQCQGPIGVKLEWPEGKVIQMATLVPNIECRVLSERVHLRGGELLTFVRRPPCPVRANVLWGDPYQSSFWASADVKPGHIALRTVCEVARLFPELAPPTVPEFFPHVSRVN